MCKHRRKGRTSYKTQGFNGSSNNNKKATGFHTNSDPALYVKLKGASILHKNCCTVDLIASETLSPHIFPTSD